MNTSSQLTKLIFAGLDSAGKTTIYKATMKEIPVQELASTKPTRGIERNISDFMDLDFSVWDLGGQQSYRETYLSKPEIFNSTKALIFVVDIQDVDRFQEAYQYYLDIMNILINVEPRPKVYVLFHKFDPDKAAKLRSHFFKATKLFRQADKITGMKFTGFATSIYSDTIQKAVKRILWENLDNYTPDLTTPTSQAPKKAETIPRIGETAPKISTPTPTASTPTSSATSTTPSTAPSSSAPPSVVPKPTKSVATDEFLSEKLSDKLDSLLSDIEKEEKPSVPPPPSSPSSLKSKAIPEPTPVPKAPTPVPSSPPPTSPSAMEEKSSSPTEVKSETESEDIVSSIPSPVYEEGKTYEEVPDLSDLSTHIVDQLSAVITKRMNETPEIVALAILGLDGKVPLAVAKSEIEKEKIEIVKNVVQSLSPKQFFKEIGDIEYRGLGHLTFDDFDIYFAKLQDEYAIAILAVDVSTPMLENAQRIVKTIRQGLGMVSGSKATEEEEKEEKVDLIGDLRSRLKKISSLHNVDDN